LSDDRRPFALVDGNFRVQNGHLSPDGHWLAYDSNELGQFDVYVQSFPPTGAKWRVSKTGGRWPVWRADGKELFYMRSDGTVFAAAVSVTTTRFDAREPKPLFRARVDTTDPNPLSLFVPSADGQRFLVNTLMRDERPPIGIIENWTGVLAKD